MGKKKNNKAMKDSFPRNKVMTKQLEVIEKNLKKAINAVGIKGQGDNANIPDGKSYIAGIERLNDVYRDGKRATDLYKDLDTKTLPAIYKKLKAIDDEVMQMADTFDKKIRNS